MHDEALGTKVVLSIYTLILGVEHELEASYQDTHAVVIEAVSEDRGDGVRQFACGLKYLRGE